MNQHIHDIIRSQWPLRHSADVHTRIRARNLILVHIALAREMALTPERQSATHVVPQMIAPIDTPFPHAA